MSEALDGAVELLERALGYTRATLQGLDDSPAGLARPTPCTRWDLGRLLAHMEDALDAFTEAAAGLVEVHPVPATPAARSRVDSLQVKACTLLEAWLGATGATGGHRAGVEVGAGASMAAPLLVATAALEITVHGWDVGQATGAGQRIPTDLAGGLLGLATGLVGPADRVSRFGPPLESPGRLEVDEQLLAWLGRVPGRRTGAPRFWERRGLRAGA